MNRVRTGAALMSKNDRKAGWKPGWQSSNDPWDGSRYQERSEAEDTARKAAQERAREEAHQKRQQKRAAAAERRHAKREKERRKEELADRNARVFAAVTRKDADGTRHCPRCDGSDFKSERREGAGTEAAAGAAAGFVQGARLSPVVGVFAAPVTVAAGAISSWRDATFKVCQTCGAAYPLKRPGKPTPS